MILYKSMTNAWEEIKEFDIIKRIVTLKTKLSEEERPVHRAAYNILKYVYSCAIRDPIEGDGDDTAEMGSIVVAARILYEMGGHNAVFKFFSNWVRNMVPKRYEGRICWIMFTTIGAIHKLEES